MSTDVVLTLTAASGSSSCSSSEDGERAFKSIDEELRNGAHLTLSFAGVKDLTSAFLNAAVGQLYGKYDSDFLRAHLKVSDIGDDDAALLKRVVDTAKRYFEDTSRMDKAAREAFDK